MDPEILSKLEGSKLDFDLADALRVLNEKGESLEKREQAANGLAWYGGERGIQALLRLLDDEREAIEIRSQAIFPLADLKQEVRAIGPLIRILLNSSYSEDCRIRALSGLDLLYSSDNAPMHSEAVPALIETLERGSRKLKVQAAHLLGRLRDDRAVEPLLAALQSADDKVKRPAIVALGSVGGARAVQPLTALATDAAVKVNLRAPALRSLGRLGDRSVTPLLKSFIGHEDARLHKAAVEALGRVNSPEACNALLRVAADKQESAKVRRLALVDLLQEEDAAALILARKILADKSEDCDLRLAALEKLAELNKSTARDVLVQALHDEDPRIRAKATHYLGEPGDESLVEPMIRLLLDPDNDVRHGAALALGEMGDKSAEEALIKLMNDATAGKYPRSAAASSLGDLGKLSSLEPLMRALEVDADHEIACSIATALGKLGDKQAVEPLIRLIRDADDICIYAIKALGKLDDQRAVEPIVQTLRNDDRYVRCYAVQALGKLGDERALPYLEWFAKYGTEWIYGLGYVKDLAQEGIHNIRNNS